VIGTGAAASAVGLGLAFAPVNVRRTLAEDNFFEPEVRASKDGLLDTQLDAAISHTTLNGLPAILSVYEGTYPGPTLHFRPGDTVNLHLMNNLYPTDGMAPMTAPSMAHVEADDVNPTNLHVHGLHVSPSGHSDNVLYEVKLGTTFDYSYQLPKNHPAGLYWYHPHRHGFSNEQVLGGMAGAIIIQGDIDEIPGIAGVKERMIFLQASPITCPTDPSQPCGLSPNSARNQQTFQHFVNGRRNPTITIQPGETQRWRIANSSAFTFFRLKLDGHVMHQIAQDGNTLDVVVPHDEIVLGPAERAEVLIQGGVAGSYRFRTLPFDLQQGPGGLTAQEGAVGPDVTLATLVSQGDSVVRQPLPTKLLPYVDLRNVPIDGQRRLISFQVQPNGNFDINNLTFDHERVDQTMKLGTTEEWTIRNGSNVFHPFHIHINPFQITAVNGRPYEGHGYKDTVSIPPQGELTFRTQFLDFTGQYVFHCHILTHEDSGMMQLIEVVD